MQHTTNYNLNQWEDGDVVRREDFNADNAAIDAALKSVSDAAANVPEIVFGYYMGNGEASRLIDLGRQPKVVFVQSMQKVPGANRHLCAMAIFGFPVTNGGDDFVVAAQYTGFRVWYNSATASQCPFANCSGIDYVYFAIF